MQLNYKKQGKGPDLVILHGFLGSLDNWQTQARKLEDEYTVWTLDLRNHGRSPHSDDHTYQIMATDLSAFCDEHELGKFHLLGHSMGAKVAMYFADQHPECLDKLMLVDMGVKEYKGGHEEILDALNNLPVNEITSRQEAETHMSKSIRDWSIRQFLLKNLARKPGNEYAWRFNLSALTNAYANILEAFKPSEPYEGNTFFIRGGKSPYLADGDWDDILQAFPNASLATIPKAGHWVHAEATDLFLKEVRQFLDN